MVGLLPHLGDRFGLAVTVGDVDDDLGERVAKLGSVVTRVCRDELGAWVKSPHVNVSTAVP